MCERLDLDIKPYIFPEKKKFNFRFSEVGTQGMRNKKTIPNKIIKESVLFFSIVYKTTQKNCNSEQIHFLLSRKIVHFTATFVIKAVKWKRLPFEASPSSIGKILLQCNLISLMKIAHISSYNTVFHYFSDSDSFFFFFASNIAFSLIVRNLCRVFIHYEVAQQKREKK